MARPSIVLLVLVKCCAVWAEYGDYGDYGDNEGYYLEGSTKGGSGYNYGDGFDKKAKDGYGYENHSEYGHGDGGDGDNGSYESSFSYGHDEKPKYSAYSYSSSSGTPYDALSDEGDYDGDYDATKVKPKKVEAEAPVGRTYQNLYNAPSAYGGFDVPGAYSTANGVYSNNADASSVYKDAQEALRSVELLSKLAGPKYKQLFLPSRR